MENEIKEKEFVWKKETKGKNPVTNALVCGKTEQGDETCRFIEGYEDELEREVMEIENKGWGIEVKAGEDKEFQQVDASNQEENIRGRRISLGF